ncbi:MAG: hypothetical protein BGO86_00825 [Chryseobacterium sp. 36-9]|nr:MAG: hypothetical protein BGO86_00825 [Chryseobacterium sp. 36-9]
MALENLISVEFTNAELTKLDDAISMIESVLLGKTINLTPEQRQHCRAEQTLCEQSQRLYGAVSAVCSTVFGQGRV